MPLEEMSSFFNARLDGYEAHMLRAGKSIYRDVARLIPKTPGLKLLDLGCGTGLEIDEIFKVNPTIHITGIDLTESMLKKLGQKHASHKKQLKLVVADYFNSDFGISKFDIALSVQTLHHFIAEKKIELYKKIYFGLKTQGFYIESDYMAPTLELEKSCFEENQRLRAEQGITEGYYHHDIPYTLEHQVEMLQKAGFCAIKIVSRGEKGAILVAGK